MSLLTEINDIIAGHATEATILADAKALIEDVSTLLEQNGINEMGSIKDLINERSISGREHNMGDTTGSMKDAVKNLEKEADNKNQTYKKLQALKQQLERTLEDPRINSKSSEFIRSVTDKLTRVNNNLEKLKRIMSGDNQG